MTINTNMPKKKWKYNKNRDNFNGYNETINLIYFYNSPPDIEECIKLRIYYKKLQPQMRKSPI